MLNFPGLVFQAEFKELLSRLSDSLLTHASGNWFQLFTTRWENTF